MTKQEKLEWEELYEYVKLEILGYKDKALPKNLVLRLKGLSEGKFMANKSTKAKAKYSFNSILMTFKINKYYISNILKDERKFQNEGHKINYIMIIIENKINDVVDKINHAEKSKLKGESVEVTVNNDKAEYTKKTKETNSDILNDLW